MEGLVWIVGLVALVVVAMIVGPGKRHRRPRWTSSSDLDPVILANTDSHEHHHHDQGGHHHHDGGGHFGGGHH